MLMPKKATVSFISQSTCLNLKVVHILIKVRSYAYKNKPFLDVKGQNYILTKGHSQLSSNLSDWMGG